MKFIKKLFKDQPVFKIVSDQKSIRLYKDENLKEEIDWNEVKEIRVFKRDLLTYDCICIAFDLKNDTTFEIDEEIEGYQETFKVLLETFKGIKEDWFFDVAFPAFETNMKTIWKED